MSMQTTTVRPAQMADLEQIAQLFDLYRQFYLRPPDLPLARRFISDRLANRQSVIFVASVHSEDLVGFTQLYPTFCSVSAAPIHVLYDLYVAKSARRHGVAQALMAEACEYSRTTGAVRLELSTAKTNVGAQALYESLGWVRDEEFHRYSLGVDG
jgi:ribosomal protein S18 acetylase RimI-like enzyme